MTILRIINVLLGGFVGFFGIALVGTVILVNACTTDSFAVPYTAPLTPFTLKAARDLFIRSRSSQNCEGGTIEKMNGAR